MFNPKSTISHYFTPTEGNNYRAKLLHLDSLFGFLVFAIFFSVFLSSSLGIKILGVAKDIQPDALYQMVNQQRQSHGLKPLTIDSQLNNAASAKANDMFQKNYWAHYGPNGETPWQFITASGYDYLSAGENLAQGYMQSQNVVDAWMNSPTHRDNILKSDYENVGYAIANGTLEGEETTLVVQMFGTRLVSQNNKQPSENFARAPNNIAQAKEPTGLLNSPTTEPVPSAFVAGQNKENVPPKNNQLLSSALSNTSSRQVSVNFSFMIFGILILALLADIFYAYRLHLIRITGKNMAHLFFLIIIIASLFMLSQGSIL